MIVNGVDISALEGWMLKINSNPSFFGKNMNRRWFRVCHVPRGSEQKLIISYSTSKTSKEPRGWLYLDDVTGVYCRRDMIEVVSPARTIRFKGENQLEHRLWSDSLHQLCNPNRQEPSQGAKDTPLRSTSTAEQKPLSSPRDELSNASRGSTRRDRGRESPRGKAYPRDDEYRKPMRGEAKEDEHFDDDRSSDYSDRSSRDRSRSPSPPPRDSRSAQRGESQRSASPRVSDHRSHSPRSPPSPRPRTSHSDRDRDDEEASDRESERGSSSHSQSLTRGTALRQTRDLSFSEEEDDEDDVRVHQEITSKKSQAKSSPRKSTTSQAKDRESTQATEAAESRLSRKRSARPEELTPRVDETSVKSSVEQKVATAVVSKHSSEYFDDEEEEDEGESKPVAHTKPSKQDRAASGLGNNHRNSRGDATLVSGTESSPACHKGQQMVKAALSPHDDGIARDNNFVDDDWDEPDADTTNSMPLHQQKGVKVGYGGVTADSNWVTEDWDE